MAFLDRFFGPPTRDAFARAVLRGLRQAGDPRRATYVRDQFQIRYSDGEGNEVGLTNLHNLYEEHRQLKRPARKGHLRHVVRALLSDHKEIPEEYQDAKPDLLPIVRTRAYLEFFRLRHLPGDGGASAGDSDPDIPWVEIGDHFAAMLVYDLPESMRTLPQAQLDGWDVSFYRALEDAKENLADIGFSLAQIEGVAYLSFTRDNYDASRVLLTDLIERLEFDGEPVALIPNRDQLLLTGSENERGLELVAALAEDSLDHPRSMTAVPMILRAGEWETWRLPQDHPSSQAFRRLRIRSFFGEYADQKSLLEERFAADEVDIFVASYQVRDRDPDDPHVAIKSATEEDTHLEVVSYCVWSDGVDALLPETDEVIFYRESDNLMLPVDRVKVDELIGYLLTPTDHYPPRVRVSTFPSEKELQALRNA